MNLTTLTNKNLITLNSDLKNKLEIIDFLVNKLFEDGKISDKEGFKQAILAREELSETGMDDGLAIPHGKSSFVKEAAFAVISTKEVVEDWESLEEDNEVKYIFMLAIPEGQAGSTHLELLSELMQRMSDSDYKHKLFSSKSVEEFMKNLDDEVEEVEDTTVYTKTIVAVTACPAGIAHTYMAAEALVKAGKELGIKVYVEKQGANGIEDRHTNELLESADAAIFAVGVAVKEEERFKHLPTIKVPVAEPIKTGVKVLEKALKKAEETPKGTFEASEVKEEKENIGKVIYQAVMSGLSHIVPLLVASGMIGAIAVLITQWGNYDWVFDKDNPVKDHWLYEFKQINAIFGGYLLPTVLAGFTSFAIAKKQGLVAGFAAGAAAIIAGSGFFGAMVGGVFAGFVVLALQKYIPAKGRAAGLISFWVYPVLSSIIVSLVGLFVIGFPLAWFNTWFASVLGGLNGGSSIILGIIIGIMVSFDLGGPINKVAYTFCAAAMTPTLESGIDPNYIPYAIFASVKMVSGLAITFATVARRNKFDKEEVEIGKNTWVLALAGITEGGIPFMIKNPLSVIVSLCAGSAVTGAIVSFFGVGLEVPGAGIFSVLLLSNHSLPIAILIWVGAALIGAVISALLLIVTKDLFKKNKEKEAN